MNGDKDLVKSRPGTITMAEEFNTTHIAQLVETDELDAAIVPLNAQAEVINVFGQAAANRQVVLQIQNFIVALKTQEPSPPPPPAIQSYNSEYS